VTCWIIESVVVIILSVYGWLISTVFKSLFRLYSTDLRLPNRTTVMSGALPFTPNVGPFIPPPAADTATSLFDHFCSTNTFHSILDTFQQLCDVLELRRDGGGSSMLRQLSTKLTSSWRAQSLWTKLEKRAGHWEYRKGAACAGTRVSLWIITLCSVGVVLRGRFNSL